MKHVVQLGHDTLMLQKLNAKLHSCPLEDVSVCSTIRKYTSCTLNSYTYRTSHKSCVAFASWKVDLFGPSPSTLPDQDHPNVNEWPIDISYFSKVKVYVCNSSDASTSICRCTCVLVPTSPRSAAN